MRTKIDDEIEVKLVNWTPRPVETMVWAFRNMHRKIGETIPDVSEYDKADFIALLKTIRHKTVMEYVSTIWFITKGTRAFQQQLTRTRQASYSIQSLRVVQKIPSEAYIYPKSIRNNTAAFLHVKNVLDILDETSIELADCRIPQEDIRSIYPINVESPITMTINLRALSHMLTDRLCIEAQGEFRSAAHQMVDEIIQKMDPCLGPLFGPPCEEAGICSSAVYCGKEGINRLAVDNEKAKKFLWGE